MTSSRLCFSLEWASLALALLACRSAGVVPDGGLRLNDDLSARLFQAAERGDREGAMKLLTPVLKDEARGGYFYGYKTRMNVHYAILELNLREAAPLLREVALRTYSIPPPAPAAKRNLESYHDLLRITAIECALRELTDLSDGQAIPLNRAHIATPLIGATAIRNLQRLGDWDATEGIRRMLEQQEPTERFFLTIADGLSFLAASPQAQPGDCAIVQRMSAAFASCFDKTRPPGRAGCDDFVPATRALTERFRCPPPASPTGRPPAR